MPTLRLTETPFAAGEAIGERYVIERVIAEGGMGMVVAARHLELEEIVAIKFLKAEFARSPDIVGRFAREAKAAVKIKSEYSAKLLDVGVSVERGPYIVMEYLEGSDLEVVLNNSGRMTIARSVEIVLQVCEALAEAHSYGIVHRDIKPGNLFLATRDHDIPVIKVLDFGISKAALTGNMFGGAISFVKTQSLLGTPVYMSPEQLRGGVDAGSLSDIWSLGAVLYELLSGALPFTGNSVTEICANVLEQTPPALSSLVPEIPPELEAIVKKAMAKVQKERYGTIAEFAVALAPFAPKRARMCVERAVAVSKAAGLLPADFNAAHSVAPPSMTATQPGTAARIVAQAAPGPVNATSLAALSPAPVDIGAAEALDRGKKKVALLLGIFLVLAAVVIYFLRGRGTQEQGPPIAAVPSSKSAPEPTPVVAERAPVAAAVAAPSEAPVRAPTSAAPLTAKPAPPARPGGAQVSAANNWGRPPSRPMLPPTGVVASAPPAAAQPPPTNPTGTSTRMPSTNVTRSAIDDRK
jgi:predicted Ser/Thr protein kinase